MRRTAEDVRKLALAPTDGSRGYIHHDDGSWSFVGNDGWPVSPEDYYAELDADRAAVAAVTCAPVDAELLTAVLRGLTTIDVEPISVRDPEV
ncbi:hypothetical protein IU479_06590 [Nocardia abscessus]|uniref:hypothetical protein n=1 Tax=Nocardia TaxID=1817 RepID=UPI001894EF47|nr:MULTISPECIES: hypothetical protein [Nocardia]MBF6217774.1 hypothetical protein [Nocardia abscessus]MDE1672878.1 hypothetical protein [Nocardia gipuzkoensis]